MEPGRELDMLVGREVMGCRVVKQRGRKSHLWKLKVPGSFDRADWCEEEGAWSAMPAYSTDIAAAWAVVEKMHERTAETWSVAWGCDRRGRVCASVDWEGNPRQPWRPIYATTTPHAICLAALEVVGVGR